MSELVTRGIHHVTLVGRDAGRTLAFYRDVLGLELVASAANEDDPGARVLYLGEGAGRPGTRIEVLEWRDAGPGRAGIGGMHHVAFGVRGDEELLRWKRRLTDLGVRASGPYDRGYFTSLYFRDPDGQVLEIATAGPGYAVDEPADALGRELKLPPQRIVRGHRDEAAIAALTHPEPVPEIEPGMVLSGIHHVSGITDDLARAGDFYEAALGLRLVKRTTNRDDPGTLHYFWASYDGAEVAPHSSFTLFGWPASWHRSRAGVGQMHRVSFRARDGEELGAWADRLRSLGVGVSEARDGAGFRGVLFRAPDGQLLEIATDGPGIAVDAAEPGRAEAAGSLPPLG